MIWWALDQRRRWRAKMQEEAKAQGIAEALNSGRAAANAGETLEDWLKRMEEQRAKSD